MNDTTRLPGRCATAALLVLAAGLAGAQGRNVRTADYIVAVVNQELVTAGEIEQRGLEDCQHQRANTHRTDARQTKFVALNILEKVGGNDAVMGLQAFANTSLDQDVKRRALETADLIRTRPKKK